METKDWILAGLSLLGLGSSFYAVWVSVKRLPTQNYKDNAEANLTVLTMVEKATEMAKEARDDYEKVLKAIGGKASITGFFHIEELIKNGEAPIYGGKIVLEPDFKVVKSSQSG